jgi:hypothetical protein
MTIGVAWIRKGITSDELWLASDSRLTGDGNIWDDCPKLLPLPRRDAVAGFSGSTAQAYPLLLQVSNAIGSYRAAADGSLEFFHLLGHLERVINAMMSRITPDPAITGVSPTRPEFATSGDTLVIGGYSRAQGRLVIRSLRYLSAQQRWVFQRPPSRPSIGRDRVIVIFGDNKSVSRFRYLLNLLLQERAILPGRTFSFEPLETLTIMLQMPESAAHNLPMDRRPTTIGGAPQVIRLLPGAQATAMAVQWQRGDNVAVYLQGRETFLYENLDVPLIAFDGSQPHYYAPAHWPESAIHSQEAGGGEPGIITTEDQVLS